MKKILALAVVVALAAGCTKDPTLADRMEGDWLVNDITASGQITIFGSVVPLIANDKSITSTSTFTMIQEPNSVAYSVDAVLEVSAGTTFDFPWQQGGNGTWQTIPGNGVAPDSVYLVTDSSTTKYEVLNLLDNDVRLRTLTAVDFQGQGINLLLEMGFARQ
ncbi:MAG: hypothetical protein P8K75_05200 [Schleiferiaceae bacterium]|nr:hypothetical protein [Schleiferiaceae bacterium]